MLFAVALVAVACGSETVVVTGPSLQPSTAAPSADEVQLPDDFQLDTSIFADADADADGDPDDEGAAGPAESDTDGPADDGSGDDKTAVDVDVDDGDGDGGGVPTGVTLLRSAATETTAVDSYRFEVRFEMYVAEGGTVLDIAPAEPLSVGAISGNRTWLFTDIGPIFDAIFDAAGGGSVTDLLGDDLSMEAITEGTSMYLRAPLFASMAELGALPGADDLVALGDGWGRVDLAAAGLSPEEIAGLTGAQTGASAEDLLALLGAVGGDVSDLGATEVRGVPTTRYRAEISLGAVLEAQSMSADEIGALSAAGIDNVTIPFDIDVDADGRIRRMEVVIDTSFISDLVGESAPAGTEARISTIVELYDFGAAIDIVDPTTLGATDVTSSFLALANG